MPERVVAVVRHRAAVLCCRAGGLSLPVRTTDGDDPIAALRSLLDELGVEPGAIERQREHEGALVALATASERGPDPDDACPDPAWLPPSRLREEGSERQWRTYRAVAPTVDTVARDAERGSTAIAVDALWVLRDAATEATSSGVPEPVHTKAEQLLDARPSMAVLVNRVNRVMSEARTPAEIEDAATEAIIETHAATAAAAKVAAETVGDGPVLTLSRSGTVRSALMTGRPTVEVLVSLPGGEGREVAERLSAAGLSVSVVPDAAVYDRLRSGAVTSVLVGADAVTSDGGLVNKVGTRAAALAAELSETPFYAVCASHKIRPLAEPDEPEVPLEPLFDWTPPRLVTAVLTERGPLTTDAIESVAAEHRALTDWRAPDPG